MRKWVFHAFVGASLVAGALWAASAQEPAPKEEPELEEFEPTEKVPADSSVSFPVDI